MAGFTGKNENPETVLPSNRKEWKTFLQRKRRYEQTIHPLRSELLQIVKEAEREAEEIKRRALEEADSIRSSTRLNVEGSPGPSNVTPGEDVEGARCVRGRNVMDEAPEILKFTQSFAAEARAETEKVLVDARAAVDNILSSAQTEAAVITARSSATADSKQQRRREWDANRKRMQYWEGRSVDMSSDQPQSKTSTRDARRRTIRKIMTDFVEVFNMRTRAFSLATKQLVCERFWVHRTMSRLQPSSLGCNYVEAMGQGEGITDRWDEGTLADVVEVGDFFAVEAEWPIDYNAEFWVLQCTKPLHVLGHTITDAYGETHDEESTVLEGLWYQQFGKSPTCFVRYDSAPTSVVAGRRVIHVRFALSPTGVLRNSPSFKLSSDTLEAVLASLQRY
ncbi:hypothetical protein R1sor_026659 [Riccia sorocarpa]|uniref:Uncharacterized protein n=1 Tax=Riccia sorocarpa TaxID=122646 RepID=A0ABD3GDQ9_9MARC